MQRQALRLSVSVLTFVLGLAASTVPSFFHLNAAPSSQYEREVLVANDGYLNAHTRRDVAALDDLLADEFTVEGYLVRGADKARRLAQVANPDVSFVSMANSDVRVTASASAGEVSGRGVLVVRLRGQDYASRPYLFTRRFERRGGRWQVVSVHVTPTE